jgi:hypothetical protein
LIENEIKLSDTLQDQLLGPVTNNNTASVDQNMRRLDLLNNSIAVPISVEISKEKTSPNLEGSSTIHPRREMESRSPLSHL